MSIHYLYDLNISVFFLLTSKSISTPVTKKLFACRIDVKLIDLFLHVPFTAKCSADRFHFHTVNQINQTPSHTLLVLLFIAVFKDIVVYSNIINTGDSRRVTLKVKMG